MDLRFAQYHRVEASGNAEKVRGNVLIASSINERRGIVAQSRREKGRDPPDGIPSLLDGVDLGAVARRQNYTLADRTRFAQTRKLADGFLRTERELLANFDWRRSVAHTADDHRHLSTFSVKDPSSTELQKSSAISLGAASRQRSSPPAIRRDRNPRRAETARPYRESNRSAIASRILAAAPGTPPAET